MINQCAALDEKLNGRDSFGNLDVAGVIILKWILTNECTKMGRVFFWLRAIQQFGFSGQGNELSGSIKHAIFLNYIGGYQF
jgi:hypothetical protein